MDSYLIPSTAAIAALAVSVFLFSKSGDEEGKKLPPGPPQTIVVGNTLQVPMIRPWIYFEKLGEKYGPIYRLSLGGDEVLVLNDAKDADELLNRRSNNYSSRKPLTYVGKYRSKDRRLVLLHYGEEMRKQRAAFHTILQPRALSTYEAAQERESLRLLNNILDKPSETHLHSKLYAASLVYTLAYGKDLNEEGLKELLAILDIVEAFILDCMPGAHLVDMFPVLDRLPDFLSPWRKEALKKHEYEMGLYGRLFLEVKERSKVPGSTANECFAARLWEEREKHGLDVTSMTYAAGSAVEAGTDSTAASLIWFIMAVILYPETLEKAQKEVDSVVGAEGSTMPTFANVDNMPYCFALVKEVLRWHPATPISFHHFSDHDDTYKGYFIRGKTMVIPNVYAMHRNEAEYPDATRFLPERFLKDLVHPLNFSAISEGHYAFGFGRRVCPGKLFAAQTVWIGIVRLIWAFNFTHARDENGETIPVIAGNSTSGVVCKPEPFAFKLSPRSPTHEETLRREWSDVQRQR
ncbi:cytochrome P450 [Schizopora paradoxa]|uniref:Cytochrome P450 n=1 Tax=Schizopora paradoxa TaxID=27342 RepID=A0A0H2RML4_9AGAM|nr:cytochrome P450 [Schizopora paradoxa]